MRTRHRITSRPRVEELEGRLVPSTLSTSTNWSGYAVVTNPGAVTAVSGTWVVPAVTTTTNGYSSAWVGIDGFNSNTVEQIGTEMDYNYGQVQYYAWYEMYPNGSISLPLTIRPNDTISASVSYSSSQYTLALTDVTSGKSYKTTQTAAGAQRSSAEWIVEAPSNGYSILPLDNFGTVQFSNSKATVGSATGAINTVTAGSGVNQINMVNGRTNAQEDATSGLTDSGSGSSATSSFTVTATVATTSPPPPSGHHRGGFGGWSWWSPNMMASPTTTSPAALAVAAGIGATAPGLLNSTPMHSLTGATMVGTTPTGISAPALTAALAQSSAALAGSSDALRQPSTEATVQPAGPELLPAPNESDAPGGATLPPGRPEQTPNPAQDDLPAGLQGAAVDWRRASDACFADQRWEPAPALEGSRAATVSTEDEGTGSQTAAGAVALLALGGAWSIVVDQPAARRYKQRPLR